MPIRRRLRYAEYLRQGLDADRFRAALFRLLQRSLDQRVAKIAMVIGTERLADDLRRHLTIVTIFGLTRESDTNVICYNLSASTIGLRRRHKNEEAIRAGQTARDR